jgi:hypothetical protein
MIFDSALVLAGSINAAGAITGQSMNGAGPILGINTVDMGPCTTFGGNQVTDGGTGESLEISISVLTAPTVGTNVQFQLVQADDPALTVNLQVINQTDAFPIASLPAGSLVPLHWDRAAPYPPKRYIGLRIVNTGAIATLSVFAAVVKSMQDVKNIVFRGGYGVQ